MTDDNSLKIILYAMDGPPLAVAPRTSHREFREYIDADEEAGLDPQDTPPKELQELIGELEAASSSVESAPIGVQGPRATCRACA